MTNTNEHINVKTVLKILSVLTHILSACNTGCLKTETPNLFHSLWPASYEDHYEKEKTCIRQIVILNNLVKLKVM